MSWKVVLVNMAKFLIMSANLATLGFLKIKAFCNKVYEVTNSICEITNKFLSLEANHIGNVVRWPKYGNSGISTREVIITSILWEFDWKYFFWRVLLLEVQSNNLRLAVGMALKFYNRVTKGLQNRGYFLRL